MSRPREESRDINLGVESSSPCYFVLLNGRVLFAAESSLGSELWAVDWSRIFNDGFELGNTSAWY